MPFNQQRLQAAANVVARAIMSEEGRMRHELAGTVANMERMKPRGGLVSERYPKATKVLVIKLATNSAGPGGLDWEKYASPAPQVGQQTLDKGAAINSEHFSRAAVSPLVGSMSDSTASQKE